MIAGAEKGCAAIWEAVNEVGHRISAFPPQSSRSFQPNSAPIGVGESHSFDLVNFHAVPFGWGLVDCNIDIEIKMKFGDSPVKVYADSFEIGKSEFDFEEGMVKYAYLTSGPYSQSGGEVGLGFFKLSSAGKSETGFKIDETPVEVETAFGITYEANPRGLGTVAVLGLYGLAQVYGIPVLPPVPMPVPGGVLP